MTRIAVGLEYDGTRYAGWQTQQSAEHACRCWSRRRFSSVAAERGEPGLRRTYRRRRACARPGRPLRHGREPQHARPGCWEPTPSCLATSASPGCGRCRRTFTRATRRRRAPTAISSSTAPPARRLCGAARCLDLPPARCRADGAGGRGAAWASMTSARSAPPGVRRIADPPHGAAGRRAAGRLDHRSRPPRTPSCTTWCATSPGCCIADRQGRCAALLGAPRCWRAATARERPHGAAPMGCTSGRCAIRPAFGLPAPAVPAKRRPMMASAIMIPGSLTLGRALMSWFEKIMPSRIKTERRTRSVPEGLWIKCPACDAVLYRAELERNLYVCPKCSHHMRIGARERLSGSSTRARRPRSARRITPEDPLKFRDSKRYKDRLAQAQKATGEKRCAHRAGRHAARSCRSSPARSSSSSSAARWARWWASASSAASITASSIASRSSASPPAAARACRRRCTRCMQMAKTAAALSRLAQAHLPLHLGHDRSDHRWRVGEPRDARRSESSPSRARSSASPARASSSRRCARRCPRASSAASSCSSTARWT